MSNEKLKFDFDAFGKKVGKAIAKDRHKLAKKRRKYGKNERIDESVSVDDKHLK